MKVDKKQRFVEFVAYSFIGIILVLLAIIGVSFGWLVIKWSFGL